MAAAELGSVAAQRSRTDRPLYTWVAIAAALVVLAGFSRTYYAKAYFGTPELSALVHLHGLVMTAWFALFFVQVRLVATNRTPLHRKLGVLGGIVAILVVVVGSVTAISSVAAGRAPPRGVPPLVFLAIPLGDMVLFTINVSIALALRRRAEYHKRFMVMATLGVLTAAIARIQVDFMQNAGLPAFFAATDLLVLGFIAADTIRNRRFHPAYAWGLALLIASQAARFAIAGTPQWAAFARWLTT